jgi:hypothetical protein
MYNPKCVVYNYIGGLVATHSGYSYDTPPYGKSQHQAAALGTTCRLKKLAYQKFAFDLTKF